MEIQSSSTRWISLSMSRGPIRGPLRNVVGCVVHVTADPSIEEFMKNVSRGEVDDPARYDARWYSIPPETPLRVYSFNAQAVGMKNQTYGLDWLGSDLIIPQKQRNDLGLVETKQLANLSFLKLVGISNPEGVKFGVHGAFGEEQVRNVSKILLTETKKFLREFIVPADVNWQIISGRG